MHATRGPEPPATAARIELAAIAPPERPLLVQQHLRCEAPLPQHPERHSSNGAQPAVFEVCLRGACTRSLHGA
jgi:hypothetical protein